MLHTPVDNAVIGVGAAVDALTRKALPTLITSNTKSNTVLWTELFQLGHDAGGDEDLTLCIKSVHHALEQLDLARDGVREEICIDEDLIRWDEGGVVLKEHGGGRLWNGADYVAGSGQRAVCEDGTGAIKLVGAYSVLH